MDREEIEQKIKGTMMRIRDGELQIQWAGWNSFGGRAEDHQNFEIYENNKQIGVVELGEHLAITCVPIDQDVKYGHYCIINYIIEDEELDKLVTEDIINAFYRDDNKVCTWFTKEDGAVHLPCGDESVPRYSVLFDMKNGYDASGFKMLLLKQWIVNCDSLTDAEKCVYHDAVHSVDDGLDTLKSLTKDCCAFIKVLQELDFDIDETNKALKNRYDDIEIQEAWDELDQEGRDYIESLSQDDKEM